MFSYIHSIKFILIISHSIFIIKDRNRKEKFGFVANNFLPFELYFDKYLIYFGTKSIINLTNYYDGSFLYFIFLFYLRLLSDHKENTKQNLFLIYKIPTHENLFGLNNIKWIIIQIIWIVMFILSK